jgi:hypothetical protein
MKSANKNSLKEQLYDPIRFLDGQTYIDMRKAIVARALIVTAAGLVILIVGPILYEHGQLGGSGYRENRRNSGLVFLAIGLPLYGLYRLLTIKSAIASKRRAQLLWLHPELKAIEAKRKVDQKTQDKKPTIILMTLVFIVVSVGLFFYVRSLIEFAQSP